MDELTIMTVPEPNNLLGTGGALMFQQIARVKEGIVKGSDWDEIATRQLSTVFTMTDVTDRDLAQMAELYADDLSENVLEPPVDGK